VNIQYGMLDKRQALRQSGTQYQHPAAALNNPQKQPVTEQEKSYPCKDPLPPFPEGSLRRQYICQVNKDSLPGEACQEREFRTGNPPLRPSLARLLLEEVKLLRFPQAVCLQAERDHLD
jgi:hypothetical protein